MIKECIQKLVDGISLTYEEARRVMEEIMLGNVSSTQVAAFLTALRMKGETVDEIMAFTSVMRDFCCKINPQVDGRLIDTCGTGGDKIKTFNISTTVAFVVAGAGIAVAKHGNRSVTSSSGSADVLEELGLKLNFEPNIVKEAIEKIGIGFIFAPTFHPAMKHVAKTRREIGIKTVFNILGPLTNPANVNAQLLGVYDLKLVHLLPHVLRNLGCNEAMVVHGLDGLDEISTIGKTVIAWLREGEIKVLKTTPRYFNIKLARPKEVIGATPRENAEITFKILNGRYSYGDPKMDIVLVNAAAGMIIGGKAESFSYGMELARESIGSGAAYRKLKELIRFYGGDTSRLEELELKYG